MNNYYKHESTLKSILDIYDDKPGIPITIYLQRRGKIIYLYLNDEILFSKKKLIMIDKLRHRFFPEIETPFTIIAQNITNKDVINGVLSIKTNGIITLEFQKTLNTLCKTLPFQFAYRAKMDKAPVIDELEKRISRLEHELKLEREK